MNYFKTLALLLIWLTFGCSQDTSNNSSQALQDIIDSYQDRESYDKEKYRLGLYTKEYYKNEAEFAQLKLEELNKVKAEDLSETDQISLELLQFVLQDEVNYYEYERYLNPILSDAGFHSSLTYQVRPITNHKQAVDYLKKLNCIPEFVDQHFVILREALEKGVSQPRVIFNGYESTYDDHIVDNFEDSFYYSPFKNLPSDLTETQKDSILTAAKQTIETNVTPQFKRIKEFFETEYLPKTRTTLGASAMPNGDALYQERINYYTTSTQYTADDLSLIHI